MKTKFEFKKLLTATNIFIAIFLVLYLLDCYLPLPNGLGYTNYIGEEGSSPGIADYILGNCGGLLTYYLGMGKVGNAFYRHFTQMFLHSGLLHLIANSVGMYFIGNYAEKKYGRWLTPILFVVTALIESYITDPLYLAMVPSAAADVANQVSVGASGGVFGLIGVSLAALFFDIKQFKKIGKPTLIVSAIYGVLPTYAFDFGWTTVCHNVGLILGLAIGALIILPFFLLKKGKFAHKAKSIVSEKDNDDVKSTNDNDCLW